MRLILSGIGRLKAGPERDLFERYLARIRGLSRTAGLSGVDSIEVDEARARSGDERKRHEAAALTARLPTGPARLIVFDERGEAVSSVSFAAGIGQARDAAKPAIVFRHRWP